MGGHTQGTQGRDLSEALTHADGDDRADQEGGDRKGDRAENRRELAKVGEAVVHRSHELTG